MQIIACVKQTPASANVPIDSATGKLKTAGLQYGLNPFDEYGIEEGLRLKDKLPGSKVAVLTLGAPSAEEALRSALAMGADEAVLLTDPSFEGSDPVATAYLLSLGVKKLSAAAPVGLVFCGKQTNDGESGSVGSALAAWLGWPGVTGVRKILEITETKAVLERLMEDGTDQVEVQLPAVVCTVKEINEPRLPSLKGKMAAKKAMIPQWKAADLAPDNTLVGASSPTTELKAWTPPPRGGGVKIDGATAQDKAAALVGKLKEMKLI